MYDVLILVYNLQKPRVFSFDKICINPLNDNANDTEKHYYSIWPFINNANGILYKLYTKQGLGEFECGDELFDLDYSATAKKSLPYYMYECNSDVSFSEDLISMSIKSAYMNEFEEALSKMIANSPIKTILFLCRGQSLDKEIILGKVSKREFFKLLNNNRAFTNICYIIGE